MENQYSMALLGYSNGVGRISKSTARQRKDSEQSVVAWLWAPRRGILKWSVEVVPECTKLEALPCPPRLQDLNAAE